MFVQCQNQSQTAGMHLRGSCMWWGGETCPKMPPWRRAELFPLPQEPKPARSWGWWTLELLVQSISEVETEIKIFLWPYQCPACWYIDRCPGCQCSSHFFFLLQISYPHTLFYTVAWFILLRSFLSLKLCFNAFSSPALLGRQNEAPRPLHEAQSGVSHVALSSSNQSWLHSGPLCCQAVTLFGRECQGRCLPLGVLLGLSSPIPPVALGV